MIRNLLKRFFFFVQLCFVIVVITGCHNKADLSVAPPFPKMPVGLNCSPDTVYFQATVLPLIINSCAKSGCHDQSTGEQGYTLDNYTGIMRLVTPGAPTASKLYTVLFNQGELHMPPNTSLSVNQDGIIYYWIQQGALDNRCESAGCDSSVVTYTTPISLIVESWCTGCHGGTDPANGLSLTTFDQVKASVNSGRLMGAIHQETGYFPMPKGSRLSACEIALFDKWVSLGMPQ
jgi:hypothetical protein